jgi:hypothetical protein
VNLDLRRCHVDIGWKNCNEQERQAPACQQLDWPHRYQQPETTEQLKKAAYEDAGSVKWYPGRHHRHEKLRAAQVNCPGKEKEHGQEKTNDETEDQGTNLPQTGQIDRQPEH